MKGLFRARGCTPEEAADLAQEAAARAYAHVLRHGVIGDGLDPLINRIARNLLIDRRRRVSPNLVPLETAAAVHDPTQDPGEEFARRQRGRAVQSALSQLPDRHQTAIRYSMVGLTPREVGDKLGIGRNAADALLHRARRSLRERLRHAGEGTFGFAFVLGARVRNGARRIVGLDAGLSATGPVVIATTTAAVAAVVVAITLAPGGTTGALSQAAGSLPAKAAQVSSSAPVVSGAQGHYTDDQTGRVAKLGLAWLGTERSPGRVATSVKIQDPGNPNEELVSVTWGLLHIDDPKTIPGGQVVSRVIDVGCGSLPALCDALRGAGHSGGE